MGLLRESSQRLTVKDFIENEKQVLRAQVRLRKAVVVFLLWAYGGLLAATMGVIILQGFHFGGFDLEPRLLRLMIYATVLEIGGLLAILSRTLFTRE